MAQSLRRLESRWLVDFRKGHRELFVADLTNPMWDKMVPDPRYRCLIPVTAFAQPEGPSGRMTRVAAAGSAGGLYPGLAGAHVPLPLGGEAR